MILGIDASNIRGLGGTTTHIYEILKSINPNEFGFEKVIVWSNIKVLNLLEEREWLIKRSHVFLNKNLLFRVYWQKFILRKQIKIESCDILFVPGGLDNSNFKPLISMSRNMLPFEWNETRRYGISWDLIRLLILKYFQISTFNKSSGLIFLSNYAKDIIMPNLKILNNFKIIPHGINLRFRNYPKKQYEIDCYTDNNLFKILYVSNINIYKHQWNLIKAVDKILSENYKVQLDIVGNIYSKKSFNLMIKSINEMNSPSKFIIFHKNVDYNDIHIFYKNADLFVFASSCENLPNILIEAMSSGLPIACSNRGPMPEILKESALYFDPESVEDIYKTIKKFINDKNLRENCALSSFILSSRYSWKYCANETFHFIREIATKYKIN